MKEVTLQTSAAAAADLPFMWGTYRDCVREQVQPLLRREWDDEAEEQCFQELLNIAECFLISVDGMPVGWGSFRSDSETVEFEHLYVISSQQGRGIGKQTIEGILSNWDPAKRGNRTLKIPDFAFAM